jgi:hypothetical protein
MHYEWIITVLDQYPAVEGQVRPPGDYFQCAFYEALPFLAPAGPFALLDPAGALVRLALQRLGFVKTTGY